MTYNRTEKAFIDSLQSIGKSLEKSQAQALRNKIAIKIIADHIGLNLKSLNAAVNKYILDTEKRINLENLFNDDK